MQHVANIKIGNWEWFAATFQDHSPIVITVNPGSMSAIAAFIGAGAACLAAYRYNREQRWKRQQAIFDYLDGWLDTPGAHNALRMLNDPSRQVPLWDFAAPERRWTVVTREDVAAAYQRDESGKFFDDPGYQAIRDSFGDFFHRLSRLERLLERRLVSKDEAWFVMEHWVNVFRNQRDEPHIRNIRSVHFAHKSSRIPSLFKRFNLDITKGSPPVRVPRRERRFEPTD